MKLIPRFVLKYFKMGSRLNDVRRYALNLKSDKSKNLIYLINMLLILETGVWKDEN